jgi:hypothetical protein
MATPPPVCESRRAVLLRLEAKFREQFAAPAASVISRRQNTLGNRVLTMISVWLGA